MRQPILVGLLIFGLFAWARPARALLGNSKEAFGLDGSIRTLGFAVDHYDNALLFGPGNDFDALSETILRLIAAGKPVTFLAYEVHGIGVLDASTENFNQARANNLFSLNPGLDGRFRFLDLTATPLEEDHIAGSFSADRLNTTVSVANLDVTAGRQAITFGKAYFWNPLDIFSPFGSSQFDRDYKAGVDALRADIAFNPFSGMNIVGALGRTLQLNGKFVEDDDFADLSWTGSAVLGRVFTTVKGWDLSLQGGKVYAGYQAGGGAVGEVFEWLQIRAEATGFLADDAQAQWLTPLTPLLPDHALVVVGGGHRFESTLDLQLEYFFNGLGAWDDWTTAFLRMSSGAALQASRHALGFYSTYEFTPIILGRFGIIQSIAETSSTELQPGIIISLSDEMDLLAGAIVHLGERPNLIFPIGNAFASEFGTQSDFYYAEFKAYF